MEWSTACPDWERRIVEKRSLITFAPLFQEEADKALDVFRGLRLKDVANAPTMGEVCRPWIIDYVSAVFGAYNAEQGERLITDFFMLISKKNSKSTTAAGIMLTALVRNWREAAEFLIVSPTIEIANNSFIPARNMVRMDETLSDLLHVQDHYRTITHRINGASLKVVAADNEAVSGKKATGVLVDELWLFGKQESAENMLLEATGGLASRPEGFTIFLSTQADEPPAGVFKQKLQYARGVRDGRIRDNGFLPVIYEFPDELLHSKAYLNRENFYITNPNLGASVSADYIAKKLAEAGESGEASIIKVAAKHLNVEIGLALRSNGWAGAEFWELQEREVAGPEEVAALCDVVDVGIDGGGLDDLLGLTVVGRVKGAREWLSWSRAWAHPKILKRHQIESARYRDYANDGDLVLTEDMAKAEEEVAAIVALFEATGLLDKVGVDPFGLGTILDALEAAKIPKEKIIGISQGWKLGAAIKTTERKLADGVLWHAAQPMMSWCVGNARVEPKGNAILVTKQASGAGKIDPLMALYNAVSLLALNPQAPGSASPQLY